MLTIIKNTIERFDMLDAAEKTKVVAAVSGGADSVSMLIALNMLCKSGKINIELEACHLNHNLRGEESDRDERFVKNLCGKMNIPLTTHSVNVVEIRKKHESLEECARNARYSFFSEFTKKDGNVKIATAHTTDDNCETVLLNFLRGAALKGLCGIPPVRDNIIRPLLNVSRSDMEKFCAEYGIEFVIDSSNFSEDFTRNKLRHNIIPLLEEINPSLKTGVNRMCGILRDDGDFLNSAAKERERQAFLKIENGKAIYNSVFLALQPSPLLNRIISSLLTQNNISPDYLKINGISEIIKAGGGKINIKKNYFAVVKKGEFYLENIHQIYRKKT